ncbi:hypothetical protein C7271_08890 [filamentous cyanobacterium CCP5]|nr:hypothetical protein C7271_08890 [filamentous cyanobacterium CCP5]
MQRLRGKRFEVNLPTPLAWKLAGTVSGLNLVFLIGFPLALWLYGGWKLAYGMPWFGVLFLTLPMFAGLLTLAMVGMSLWSGSQPAWSAVQRGYYASLTIAAILLMAIFGYWRLLGYQV